MKSVNRVTPDEIKNISKMSDREIEKKLKDILSSSGNLKGILKGIDVETVKKQLQSKNAADLSKFINSLEKVDPQLLTKIKNSLK